MGHQKNQKGKFEVIELSEYENARCQNLREPRKVVIKWKNIAINGYITKVREIANT